jgi:putative hydrolase of the HAD superfamily
MTASSPPRAVRAVFFDAVGTLLHLTPAAAEIYVETGAKYGHVLPIEIIRERLREALQQQDAKDARNGWPTSEERELRRWQEIVGHVFRSPDADLFRHLWHYFAQPSAWRLLPETSVVLAELSQRKLVLGLASNFDRRLHAVAAGFPELAPLRLRLISSEIGWRKPSPRFFAELVRSADCGADQILYVGDDPTNDVAGALASGLQGVLLNDLGGKGNLKELLEIV